ncbi:MAG TPA: recombinase family protein [bacterium]|jgi:DNA invertase Pin-like site-specific DNA recombinase|nr:recombinase family protein [bacterium]
MTPRAAGQTRAALYLRVSTDAQAENGASLLMQEERLRAYCVARGWEAGEMYRDEGLSARTMDRPGLQRLLLDAKGRRFNAVCVYSLSRLTRSVKDLGFLLETFERAKVAAVSLSESLDATTAAGRLMLNVLASVSQWERESTAERTSSVLRHKRQHLEAYSGEVLYGFRRIGDRLEAVPNELETVARILRLRSQGLSLRRIAETLAEAKVSTKKGGHWGAETIRGIVGRAEFYQRFVGRPEA